jgi:diaminohydroxyphosphoribosylaminopyrimidine deaminase/5-amino-6-(5-phosphoribosylamino)uracil reductase
MGLKKDELYINRCIELALKGAGKVSPNPMVGCVIVHNDKIIGEGYHKQYGGKHAEVNAIECVKNQSLLKESILYVNLEPCSHHGKTPPCCEFIANKKIPKVVVGCKDYSKKVNGKGITYLEKNNVKVILHNSYNSKILNKRFFNFHKNNRPYIILKWAETKDGFIDLMRSNNQKGVNWISTEYTKILVHKWRAEEDAILVGRKTVENDNPELTVREYKGINPIRIVIDPDLKLNSNYKIFNKSSKTIILNKIQNKESNNVIFLKAGNKEMIESLMKYLQKIEIISLIVEGGKKTIESFLNSNYWDEARVIKGDKKFTNGIKAPNLNRKYSNVENLGKDRIYTYFND